MIDPCVKCGKLHTTIICPPTLQDVHFVPSHIRNEEAPYLCAICGSRSDEHIKPCPAPTALDSSAADFLKAGHTDSCLKAISRSCTCSPMLVCEKCGCVFGEEWCQNNCHPPVPGFDNLRGHSPSLPPQDKHWGYGKCMGPPTVPVPVSTQTDYNFPCSPHKSIHEYDGAFKCLNCGAKWGALPGNPVMPLVCNKGEEKVSDTSNGVCKYCHGFTSWHQGKCGAELAYLGYIFAIKEREAIKAERLARKFHEVYEAFAPRFGYETREDTREFDPKSKNGQLMIAVCHEILRVEM